MRAGGEGMDGSEPGEGNIACRVTAGDLERGPWSVGEAV